MKKRFKENWKPLIFIVIVLALTAISAYPQRRFVGKVTEVTDGKTCVIQMPAGKLIAVLQYIEIPEPEQPMSTTVREHLEKLVLDKTVEFLPRNVLNDRTAGQLWIKGVDVSQQMLRDGAAWYSVAERSSQNGAESALYENNENQAKAEKRGVWSVADLKPAWEYRAEQEALREKQEREAFEKMKMASAVRTLKNTTAQRKAVAQTQMWADVGDGGQFDQPYSVGGLRIGYDPLKNVGFIFTPSIYLDFPKADFLQKVESRVYYGYRGNKANVEDSVYVIGFLTKSKSYKFLKSNGLTIMADSQKIVLKLGRRFSQREPSGDWELMFYKITRAQLQKIAGAQKISVQLGSYSGIAKALR